MENIRDIVTIDSEILGGQPVFKNTRVPIDSLFAHFEMGLSLDDFLNDFPSVSKVQALKVLEMAERLMASKNIVQLYEAAA
ncbi:MAG: DUF433 domain-containing protein [Chitinophagales bacterium]|nr:DUF433 domain-containing protein [Chitinophagales bacterium]